MDSFSYERVLVIITITPGKEDMSDVVYLTQEGLDKLAEELKHLKTVRRKEVVKHIQEAKEFGDLSENSEYEDAKNEQAFVEGRIAELEDAIRKAKVIKPQDSANHAASLGCTVTVECEGEVEVYKLVGATEADPMNGRISVDSPAGQAFLGHAKGEKVVVQAPAGKIEYKINNISF